MQRSSSPIWEHGFYVAPEGMECAASFAMVMVNTTSNTSSTGFVFEVHYYTKRNP